MNDLGRSKTLVAAPLLVLQLCVIALVIDYAWMSDDAYITLRTVDNFASGRGLTWNPGQRVQVFTHPLWALLLSALYWVTQEAFFTTLGLSIIVSAAVVVLLPRVFQTRGVATLPLFVALAMSRAFIDYSTSGLENPLTHLLLLVFLLRARDGSLATLAFLTALAGVNRLDSVLLFAPVLLWRIYGGFSTQGRAYWRVVLRAACIGAAPLWLWEAFSLLYFGSFIPNTALAKLGHGYPRIEVVQQGVFYTLDLVRHDPVTGVAIAAGVVVAIRGRNPLDLAVAAGVMAYVLYVVWVGGDFMRGRFFSAPFLASVVLLGRAGTTSAPASAALGLIISSAGLLSKNPPPMVHSKVNSPSRKIEPWGIADERQYYAGKTGLFAARKRAGGPKHGWRWAGEKYDPIPKNGEIRTAYVKGNVGIAGFYADSAVTLVDSQGLADPLLARIPARRQVDWRIGHFGRAIPRGYVKSIRTGKNSFEDPELGELWERVEKVTRGDLLSLDRLVAIWELNTGLVPELVDEERYFYYGAARRVVDEKSPRTRPLKFGGTGALLQWHEPPKDTETLELRLSRGEFEIRFYSGDEPVGVARVVSAADTAEGVGGDDDSGKKRGSAPVEAYTVAVPRTAVAGFDSLRVVPRRGPAPYFVDPATGER